MRSRLTAALLALVAVLPARADEATPVQRAIERGRDRTLVLNFWASWCAPCRKEMPALSRIATEYRARGVSVVGASIDEPETRDAARSLARELRVMYPIVYGATTADMQSLELAEAVPATAIFDRDGRIVFRLIGELTDQQLRERLDWLLGERTAQAPAELVLPPGVTAEHFQQHVAGVEDDHSHAQGGEGEEHAEEEGGSAVPT